MHQQTFHDDEVLMALLAAKKSGADAAKQQAAVLSDYLARTGQLFDMCGGAILHLRVDGRCAPGRQLRRIRHPDITVEKEVSTGFIVLIRYPIETTGNVNAQEMTLSVAAANAAADVLRRRLGVQAFVVPYSN